ncbi:MAG: CHASE3 domain-containing protein, partial [Sphingobacteriaceae bacterium]|nr:CHASE3 domain-containing protein [Sphingobacteriaceae bacterium]
MLKSTFQQKTLVGFMLTIIAVFIGVYISYSRIEEFQQDGNAVDNTQEILKFTNQVVFNIVEAESNVRGYIATEQPVYLEKYNDALSKINPSVDRVTFLLDHDPTQQAVSDSLKEHVQQKLFALTKVLWVANLDGMKKAKEVLAEDKTLDRLELMIETIRSTQSQILIKRRIESNTNSNNTKKIFYVGSVFIVLLISILFMFIRKSFNRQKITEANLLQNNLQLELISRENSQQNLLLSGTMALDRSMRGQISIESLCDIILKNISEFTTARVGSFYIFNSNLKMLELKAKHCHDSSLNQLISLGEGIIGQAAVDRKSIIINKTEGSNMTLTGSFVNVSAQSILVEPIVFNDQLIGVLELGFLSDPDMNFIER